MTESYGMIKTVAKGALRPKSPYRGKLDLFFQSNICWKPSTKSELHTLTEVTDIQYREPLRKNYQTTELAAYFCKLLESLSEPDIPAEGFHDLLKRALDHLCEKPATLVALNHFEKQTCQILGIYTPEKTVDTQILSILHHFPKARSRCLSSLD